MILSFKEKHTEKIWEGDFLKKFPDDIQKISKRKLIHIHSSINLNDLKIPPGNKLHALSKDRKGLHSISINDQWRICFKWENGNAFDVGIIDYH